jgi:hypothetical protein
MPLTPEQQAEIEAARAAPRMTPRAVTARGWRRTCIARTPCSTTALSG